MRAPRWTVLSTRGLQHGTCEPTVSACTPCPEIASNVLAQLCDTFVLTPPASDQGFDDTISETITLNVTGVDICDDNTPGSGSGQACFDYIMQVIDDVLNPSGDSDDDGLPDDWEIDNFGNLDQDGTSDPDGDGLGNLGEFNAGTDPNNPDTDGDGYIKVELHPKDFDFASGKQGRVMISTKQDDVYHTEVKTTKDDKVAQTADGKVKITAHLTPAAAC